MLVQMETAEKLIESLLKIADAYGKNGLKRKKSNEKGMKEGIAYLAKSSLFKRDNLDEKDLLVISILFGNYFDDEEGLEVREILKKIEKDRKSIFIGVERIARLKRLGILESVIESDYSLINDSQDNYEVESNVELFRSNISLSDKLLNIIYKTTGDGLHDNLEPYKDNFDYLVDQFEKLKCLTSEFDTSLTSALKARRARRTIEFGKTQKDERRVGLEKRIEGRLKVTKRKFAFEEYKKKKNLSLKEELILLLLLEDEVTCGRHYDIDDIIDIISKTPYEKLTDRKLFEKDGRLIKERILETSSRSGIFGEEKRIRLSNDLKVGLLEEKKGRKQQEIELKENDIFEVIKPTVSLDKVILHPKTSEDISLAIEMVESNTATLLNKWGVSGNNLVCPSSGKKKRQSVTMLFHGASGTGKTLTAHAVADALKSRLLTLDCSKILSCWVGESEQSTRKIFDRYKEISKGMITPPVLLLNEADQFLHRRVNSTGSTDNMYNQMQNIFLEQIEKFEGILIATTNLVENLDPAFSRRFNYKIIFRRPGKKERLKLWQVHMPLKAPLADDVDLQVLAKRYDLSGGQIAVVVRNAATRAARRGDKLLCLEDFIKASENEISGNFDDKASSIMGF